MKRFLVLLVLFLQFPFLAEGQITFQKTYDRGGAGSGRSIIRITADGGYALFSSDQVAGNSFDFFLIKTNQYGDTLWTKCYGDSSSDEVEDGLETTDHGFIILGTKRFGLDPIQTYLVRTNPLGDTVWTRSYSYNGYDLVPCSIFQTTNGGFVVAGHIDTACSNCFDAFVMRLNQQGDTLWTKAYGGNQGDLINSILQTPDQGFLAVGYTTMLGPASISSYILKLNQNGFTQWAKALAFGTFVDRARKLISTSDGGYLLTGITSSGITQDVYIMKLDSAVDTVWTRIFEVPGYAESLGLDETVDSGFIFCGIANDSLARMYLIRGDKNGDTLWTRTIPGWGDGYSVCETLDSGIITSGHLVGNNLLVKLDASGNFVCPTDTITTTVKLTPASIVNINTPAFHYDPLIKENPNTVIGSGCIATTLCSSVSISEIPNPYFEILLSPNPTTSSFTITASQSPINSIDIFNMLGEKVAGIRSVIAKAEMDMDVSNLNPGIYFVKVETENGTSVQKLIKQ